MHRESESVHCRRRRSTSTGYARSLVAYPGGVYTHTLRSLPSSRLVNVCLSITPRETCSRLCAADSSMASCSANTDVTTSGSPAPARLTNRSRACGSCCALFASMNACSSASSCAFAFAHEMSGMSGHEAVAGAYVVAVPIGGVTHARAVDLLHHVARGVAEARLQHHVTARSPEASTRYVTRLCCDDAGSASTSGVPVRAMSFQNAASRVASARSAASAGCR